MGAWDFREKKRVENNENHDRKENMSWFELTSVGAWDLVLKKGWKNNKSHDRRVLIMSD